MKKLNPLFMIVLLLSAVNFSQAATKTNQDSITTDKYMVGKDGSPESMKKLQDFFDYCSANNIKGVVSKGDYKITKAVFIGNNTNIKFEDGARFIRSFKAGLGFGGSTIQQKVKKQPLENVTLDNFNLVLTDYDCVGRQVTLYGNKMNITNMNIDGFRGAMAMVIAGNDVVLDRINIKNSGGQHGEGGIRIQGGNNIICKNSHVESGDDCFQFVPSASPTDPLFNMDISNSSYQNCTGSSAAARLIVIAKDENNNCSIKNVSFINIKGSGGERQLVFQDKSKNKFKVTLTKGSNGYELQSPLLNVRERSVFLNGEDVIVSDGKRTAPAKVSVVNNVITLSGSLDNFLSGDVEVTKQNSGVVDGITVTNFEADCSNDAKIESVYIINVYNLKTSDITLKNLNRHTIKVENVTGSFGKPRLL